MASRRPLPAQLPLAAPKFDRTGLHAVDCGCARCETGHRPTMADRDRARRSFEAAELARQQQAKREAETGAAETKRMAARERAERTQRETLALIRRMTAPVQRVPTAEEHEAMRREHGIRTRRQGR